MAVRVLVADDQDMVRAGFAMILGAQDDIEVVGEAEDGERAIAEAARLTPDVLVMDIQMPSLDGIAATRAVLARARPTPRRRERLSAQERPTRRPRTRGPSDRRR